jgi:hypothetical protein
MAKSVMGAKKCQAASAGSGAPVKNPALSEVSVELTRRYDASHRRQSHLGALRSAGKGKCQSLPADPNNKKRRFACPYWKASLEKRVRKCTNENQGWENIATLRTVRVIL